MRDDDLIQMLLEPGTGFYQPRGRWQINLGHDASSEQARMVAAHEVSHAILNSGTSYGAVMMGFALLRPTVSGAQANRMENLLASLVEGARLTHEMCATSAGIWAIRGADADRLLKPYPGYRRYLEQARAIFPSWGDGTVSKRVAVYICARVCMQSGLLAKLLDLGWETFMETPIEDHELPDTRLLSICSSAGVGWSELTAEAESQFGKHLEALHRLEIEDWSFVTEEFEPWLYERYAQALRNEGFTVLSQEGQAEQMEHLIDSLEAAGAEAPLHIGQETDPRMKTRILIYGHLGERLVTVDGKPLRAEVHVGDPVRLELPNGSDPHLFLVVRHLSSLLSRYRISEPARRTFEARARDGVSICMRTSRVEEEGRVVELFPVPVVGERDWFAVAPKDVLRLVSVSAWALQEKDWLRSRLSNLSSDRTTALIDFSPASLLDLWYDEGIACINPYSATLTAPLSVTGFFHTRATDPKGIDFVALCSPAAAESIAKHARSGGEKRREGPNPSAPPAPLDASMGIILTHLLEEEPWFDFATAADTA